MIEYIYIPIILFLYLRTCKYNLLIDDNVPRKDYLWVVTTKKIDPSFYDQKRDFLTNFTNIGVFILTCWVIHLIWGWQVALLYAVMPTNVSGVAWRTGNYYMTTVFLVLVSFFFIRASTGHPEAITAILGAWSNPLFCVVAGIFYIGALESTVSAIPYAFLATIFYWPWGGFMFIPLGMFLFGKRFRHGLRIRKERHARIGAKAGEIDFKNLFIVVKVVAYYIYLTFFPANLGFFHSFGKDQAMRGELNKINKSFYLSILLIIPTFLLFWLIDPLACLWWFLFIGIFSQFITFGQFIAERYLYIANIGFCLILYGFVQDYVHIYTILCTLYFCRSLDYIPAWKNNVNLFSSSISQFPKAPENFVNLGSYYLDKRDHVSAIKPLLVGLSLTEGNKFKLYVDIACCYANMGYFDKALHYTEEALRNCEPEKVEELLRQRADLQKRLAKIKENKEELRSKGII